MQGLWFVLVLGVYVLLIPPDADPFLAGPTVDVSRFIITALDTYSGRDDHERRAPPDVYLTGEAGQRPLRALSLHGSVVGAG